MNGDPNSLPGPSAQAAGPHSPEPQEADPSWTVVTAPPRPCPQVRIHCPNVGPSMDADEGSEPRPVTTMRQKVLQSWGGEDLTQESFLEAAAYTWPPDRAESWRMKGQHEQDPEAGAGLSPEDRGTPSVAAGGRGPRGDNELYPAAPGEHRGRAAQQRRPGKHGSSAPGAPIPDLLLGAQRQELSPTSHLLRKKNLGHATGTPGLGFLSRNLQFPLPAAAESGAQGAGRTTAPSWSAGPRPGRLAPRSLPGAH